MSEGLTLTLCDGTRVVVPDSLNLITPYVLQEQHDWFEDEIKWLRRLLRPGEQVIDIGANYGVYALTMARAVAGPAGAPTPGAPGAGLGGTVWAFEPASQTAAWLARGVAANGLPNVVLERMALSNAAGTAQLALHEQAEANSLASGEAPAGPSETVPVSTLDASLARLGWQDIHFVKMDAEGEELRILEGGARFFNEMSPLVQYEIKAGREVNLQLVQAFEGLGYRSYRLVPGLDVLMPFEHGQAVDGYLLNLFACKPDRAERLAREGWLADALPDEAAGQAAHLAHAAAAYAWQHVLVHFPYGAELVSAHRQAVAAGLGAASEPASAEMEQALSLQLFSRDPARTPAERTGALRASLALLRRLAEEQATPERLASLGRVAQEFGARTLAVRALEALVQGLIRARALEVREPFLAPGARFDALPVGPSGLGRWLLASALEEIERLTAFSSFYSGLAARERLEAIEALGRGSDEMARRLRLVRQRFGLAGG